MKHILKLEDCYKCPVLQKWDGTCIKITILKVLRVVHLSSLTSKCDKDLVYDLLEQHYVSMRDFVHNVNFAEGVMSVVGTY